MVYAVAILMISALTTVGLIAVWAATSPGNWFWRTMAFLGAMSPLLLIPAYEPFVAFVIQGAVVAAGVQLAHWRQARKSGEPFLRSRFSLKTVLLAMVPAAVLIAVWARVPEIGEVGWLSAALIAIAGGGVALVALWVLRATSISWLWRILTGVATVLALSGAMAYIDDFASRLVRDSSLLLSDSGFLDDHPEITWVIVLPVASLLLMALIVLFGGRPLNRGRMVRVALGGALLLLVAVPSTGVYWQLINPLPIPVTEVPTPNGYDEFLAAVKLVPAHPVVNSANFDSETATEQELQQASNEMAPALELVRRGLQHPAKIVPSYTMDDLQMDNVMSFRTMARGFEAQGRWLLMTGRPDQAAEVFIDGVRFGIQMPKGGLLVDDLVGIACTGVALKGLHFLSKNIPIENIPQVIAAVIRAETGREPWDDVVYRDRVWSQRWGGWYSHSMDILSRVAEENWDSSESYRSSRTRELATLRLLQLELALRLNEHDHGKQPASLDVLVPEFIEAVPLDPMSPEEEPMRYLKTASGVVPYSVGYNGIDDAGKADPDDPTFGDLRLDVLWAPQAVVTQPSVATSHDREIELEADSDEEN